MHYCLILLCTESLPMVFNTVLSMQARLCRFTAPCKCQLSCTVRVCFTFNHALIVQLTNTEIYLVAVDGVAISLRAATIVLLLPNRALTACISPSSLAMPCTTCFLQTGICRFWPAVWLRTCGRAAIALDLSCCSQDRGFNVRPTKLEQIVLTQ